MKKDILVVCFPCGSKHGKKDKRIMGSWIDYCDMCGIKGACASAPHDFGIYSNADIEKEDKEQDAI